MGTINKTAEKRKKRFHQMQMKLNEVMEPGWEDEAGSFRESDKQYHPSQLRVPALFQIQTYEDTSPPAPTTCTVLTMCFNIGYRISQML